MIQKLGECSFPALPGSGGGANGGNGYKLTAAENINDDAKIAK